MSTAEAARSTFWAVARATSIGLAAAACATLTGLAAIPGTAQARRAHDRSAHVARTLKGTETAHLHLVRQRETVLYEDGSARGVLPGRMTAELKVASLFTGSVTIHAAGGSITGHGSATPHGTGRYQSFRGTLSITGGSGRYKHVSGRVKLYGSFDRRTFALIIHASGRLSY